MLYISINMVCWFIVGAVLVGLTLGSWGAFVICAFFNANPIKMEAQNVSD